MASAQNGNNEFRVDFQGRKVSSSKSLISVESDSTVQSMCRICQSETGNKIHPCACAGTIGGIHENCLNEWVLHSKRETCEICQQQYAKSGHKFLPFRKWKRPNIQFRNLVEVTALIGLFYSSIYIGYLIGERQFVRRFIIEGLPIRECDVGRIVACLFAVVFAAGTLADVYTKIKLYFRKQSRIRFVDMCPVAKDGQHRTAGGAK